MNKKYEINFEIYDVDKMRNAIEDFSEYYKINIEGNFLIIEGDDIESLDEVFNELMNYVIGLIN
ncbi:hypothetical protein HUU51_05400 [Candidatus Gracilibacteria bacterium]|nr:hypothetical protein [Candidatus Gracilibacteria bacterium]